MTMGRPREFDTEQALHAAMDLFWLKGYEATSMQDLLTGMKLSKSSLYQTFGSKHQLFQQCLQQYRAITTQAMDELLQDASSGFSFIEELLRSLAEQATNNCEQRGCLLTNSANEFAQSDADIAKLVKTGMDGFISIFQKAIEQAQAAGDIGSEQDAASLARYLMYSITGLNLSLKAGASKKHLNQAVDIILQALK